MFKPMSINKRPIPLNIQVLFELLSLDSVSISFKFFVPLETIANHGGLCAYKHHGFWRPMDTLRDKIELEEMWESDNAPWKVWEKQNAYVSLAGKV